MPIDPEDDEFAEYNAQLSRAAFDSHVPGGDESMAGDLFDRYEGPGFDDDWGW